MYLHLHNVFRCSLSSLCVKDTWIVWSQRKHKSIEDTVKYFWVYTFVHMRGVTYQAMLSKQTIIFHCLFKTSKSWVQLFVFIGSDKCKQLPALTAQSVWTVSHRVLQIRSSIAALHPPQLSWLHTFYYLFIH